MGQALQFADPVTAANLPGGHSTGVGVPAMQYAPVGHVIHCAADVWPSYGKYLPAGHSVHVDAPVLVEYDPAGHSVGAELPAMQNDPAGHRPEHSELPIPDSIPYRPAAHAVHEEYPVPDACRPGGQIVKVPLMHDDPIGQLVYDVIEPPGLG